MQQSSKCQTLAKYILAKGWAKPNNPPASFVLNQFIKETGSRKDALGNQYHRSDVHNAQRILAEEAPYEQKESTLKVSATPVDASVMFSRINAEYKSAPQSDRRKLLQLLSVAWDVQTS